MGLKRAFLQAFGKAGRRLAQTVAPLADTNVTDLMEALRRSLQAPGARKPTAKGKAAVGKSAIVTPIGKASVRRRAS